MSREGWNFWPGLEQSLTWKPTTDSSSVKSGREFFNLSEHFGLKKVEPRLRRPSAPTRWRRSWKMEEDQQETFFGPAGHVLLWQPRGKSVSEWTNQCCCFCQTLTTRERKWPFYLFRLSGELQQEVKSVRTVKSFRNRRKLEAEKPLFSFLFKINFNKSCSVCGKPGWRIEFEPQPTISTRSA